MTTTDSQRSLAQHRPDVLTIRPSTDDGQFTLSMPVQTPTVHSAEETSLPSAPSAITAAPVFDLYRRQVNQQAVTIVFLSSALSSASNNAFSMSRSLASSITQLQKSLDFLSSSASSAIISVQESASRALQAVEASASDAVALAEESAASRLSEALAAASATGVASNRTKYQAQAVMAAQNDSVSIAVVAGAVVASFAGSTILSVSCIYLFFLRRRAKEKEREEKIRREEEEKRQEEEVVVNAALDRAIVSYIAKESPSPTSPDSQGIGRAVMMGDAISPTEPRPSFLAPPPMQASYRPRASLPRVSIPPPHSPLKAVAYTIPEQTTPMAPPGPPPTVPLPQIPARSNSSRKSPRSPKSLRRTPSRSSPDSPERIYSDIITQPLERSTSAASPKSPRNAKEDTPAQHSERRDSNWPLPRGETGAEWV